MKFEQGDRVRFSQEAIDANIGNRFQRGTITGNPQRRRGELFKVKLDDRATKHNYHHSFLEKDED